MLNQCGKILIRRNETALTNTKIIYLNCCLFGLSWFQIETLYIHIEHICTYIIPTLSET